jgi:hypothetical protein
VVITGGDTLSQVNNNDIVDGRYTVPLNIRNIENCAFMNNIKLEYIEMHDNIINIGEKAFWCREELKEIKIPKGVNILRKSVFEDCIGLEKIDGLENIRIIEQSALQNCESLHELKLGEQLESLGYCSIYKCNNIRRIKLPKSLKKVSPFAISYCESLEEIEVENIECIDPLFIAECIKLKTIRTNSIKILNYLGGGVDGVEKVVVGNSTIKVKNIYGNYYILGKDVDLGIIGVKAYEARSLADEQVYITILNCGEEIVWDRFSVLEELKRRVTLKIKQQFLEEIE